TTCYPRFDQATFHGQRWEDPLELQAVSSLTAPSPAVRLVLVPLWAILASASEFSQWASTCFSGLSLWSRLVVGRLCEAMVNRFRNAPRLTKPPRALQKP